MLYEVYITYKKYILGILVLLLVIILLTYFALHGRVTITSTDNALISVRDVNTQKIVEAKKHFAKFLPVGIYIASVKDGEKMSTRTIHVSPFSFLNFSFLNFKTPFDSSAITNYPLSSLGSSEHSLSFIDNSRSGLVVVDNNNQVHKSSEFANIQSVYWTSGDNQRGITVSDSNVYLIDGFNNKLVDLPVQAKDSASLSVARSINDTIYVTIDKTLYRKKNNDKAFIKIASIPEKMQLLDVSNDTALLHKFNSSDHDNFSYQFMTINSNGESHTHTEPVIASPDIILTAHLSPNGKYVMVVNQNKGILYDRSFKEERKLPSLTLSTGGWLSDSQIIYAQNDQIWQYDINENQADLLNVVPSAEKYIDIPIHKDSNIISSIYINQLTKQIYFSLYNNGEENLYRVSLSKDQINSQNIKLGLTSVKIFPNNCEAYYVGFMGLDYYYDDRSGVDQGSINTSCVSDITSYLDAINIDSRNIKTTNPFYN